MSNIGTKLSRCTQGVQHRCFLWGFFEFFVVFFAKIVVATCELVHAVETILGLCQIEFKLTSPGAQMF